MENNSESLTNTNTKNTSLDHSSGLPLRLEIPLSSCSNLHLFEQLQIFLQQNNIPIEITTSNPSTSSIQTGGRDQNQNPEKESKSLVYQSETTPYSMFKGFMDTFFLQKQHENIEDTKNKQLLDSMFSKDKSKKEIIHSLQTLSKTISREKESSNIESVIKEESYQKNKKKILSTSTLTNNTLYMHIKTNHNHPIDSIKGTKLYYLYQRQQNAQCAQFV
jgi:hypothetical protein